MVDLLYKAKLKVASTSTGALGDRVKHGGCVFDLQNKLKLKSKYIRENTYFISLNIVVILVIYYFNTNKNTRITYYAGFCYKMEQINLKIDEVLQRLGSMEKSTNSRLEEIEKKLAKIVVIENNIKRIENNVAGITKSQSFISEQYEGQKKTIESLTKKNTKLEKDMDEVKMNTAEKDTKIRTLESEINSLEQYGRWDMLNIKGIPKLREESTDELVIKTASLLNVQLDFQDIDISHRTSVRDDAAIIVKFNSRRKRNELYAQRKHLKDITVQQLGFESNEKIYINESLTHKNGELLKNTRKLKETKALKYIWTKNGNIFVRASDTADTKNIKSNSNIHGYAKTLQPIY